MITSERANVAGKHDFCPFCSTENIRDLEYCDHCGERVVHPDVARRRPEDLGYCGRCNTITLNHAKYCIGCGVALTEVQPSPYMPAPAVVTPSGTRSEPTFERRVDAENVSPPRSPSIGASSSSPGYGRKVDEEWPFPRHQQHVGEDIRTTSISSTRPGTARPQDEANGSGRAGAKLPAELKGFNWGAFLLGPIWGIGNKVWITLPLLIMWLIPVPTSSLGGMVAYVAGYYAIALFLGFKGNELAWRSKKWSSNQHFRNNQRLWARWGIAINALVFLLLLVPLMRGAPGA